MSLKNLLNTNLASFYQDNQFAQAYPQGGIGGNPLVQTPGVVTETSFGGTVPGNITLRSITPSVSEDGFVGSILNKLGLSKKVGKRYSNDNVWHDRNDGGNSQYPLIWTEMDPISKELKSPIQLTSLYQLVKPLERGVVDALRIGKWLSPLTTLKDVAAPEGANGFQRSVNKIKENINTSGILFLASTLALSRQNPKIVGVERVFNPLTLVLQAAGGAYGLRLQSTTLNPFYSISQYFKSSQGGERTGKTYENDVLFSQTNKENGKIIYPSSRLPSLLVEKILGYTINDDKFSITNGPEDKLTSLIQYGGGANAPLGIGATLIRRWTNTVNDRVLQRAARVWEGFADTKVDTTNTPSSNFATPVPYGTNVLSSIQRYKIFNKENNPEGEGSGYGMSEGGPQTYNSLPKDDQGRLDYLKSTKRRLDIINATSSYDQNNTLDDANLIKFSIEIISNDIGGSSEHLYFRAFIDQFSDSYKPKWDGYKYVGRAEEFYRYSSFNRDISLGFTIAAFARAEMIPLYQRINKLVGITAPSYSDIGLMRGNIVRLTVGDYLVSVPGIITGLTLTPIFDAGWDINRDNSGSVQTMGVDGYTGQLPMAIKVDSFNFTPIHDFTPTKNSPFINGVTYTNKVVQITDTQTAAGSNEAIGGNDMLTGNPTLDTEGNLVKTDDNTELKRVGFIRRQYYKVQENRLLDDEVPYSNENVFIAPSPPNVPQNLNNINFPFPNP
jgi:hypothetical protein